VVEAALAASRWRDRPTRQRTIIVPSVQLGNCWQGARSRPIAEIGRPGSLLGVLPDVEQSEYTFQLRTGDALVLFSDGITERRHQGHLFGEEELAATLRRLKGVPADRSVSEVENAAVSFGVAAPQDDMAFLAITVPVTDGGQHRWP